MSTVRVYLFSSAIFLWAGGLAQGACTGSNPTWTSTTDRASVAQCVANAANGATINVSAGSATWGSRIAIVGKSLTIKGAGAGSTIVTSGGFEIGRDGGACPAAGSDISGFTFQGSSNNYTFHLFCAQGWRIHHNTITYSDASDMLAAWGYSGDGTGGVEGLFDHNNITYGRTVYFGGVSEGDKGARRWAEPLNWGTAHYIYYEDNTVVWTNGSAGGYLNHFDGNWGCRYVARFNTIVNGRFEAHALQGQNQRGCRSWEIYNNTFTNTSNPSYREFLLRGGTGLVFHNSTDGRAQNDVINIDNPRSEQDDVIAQMGAWGACNGSSPVDQNSAGGEGYLCRDQIGASTDAFLWNLNPSNDPTQAKQAAYFWRNTTAGGAEKIVELNCVGSAAQCTRQSTKHVVLNRDFFTYQASFNGTSGIGEGTLANRPPTCTTGVGYWATDQGEWNSKHAGPDGQLYTCTTTNTWSLTYKPYTYPHPLQNAGGVVPPPTAPMPPTNLTSTIR